MVKPSDEEEKHFRQAEVDRRKSAELQKELEEIQKKEATEVSKALGIDDDALSLELVELGFDREIVGIFPVVPLIYVAWADGEVSAAERRRILDVAQDRGARTGTPAFDYLETLLTNRPKASFFDTFMSAIRRIFEKQGKGDSAKADLVEQSLSVAEASGGFLGFFGEKVSAEERKVIETMIETLGIGDSAEAQKILKNLK